MSQLRIAVCVPSYNVWSAPTALCVARMAINFCQGIHDEPPAIEVFNTHGCVLPEVRCVLVANAYRWGATHMLFVDADMSFPPDSLYKLLRHGKPIVGANYVRRGLPTYPTAWLPGGLTDKSGCLWTEPGDERLLEVAHAGTGLMLIDMRVFEHLEWPFFDFAPPLKPGQGWLTDDVYFCRKARAAGIPVFCDQDLSQQVGHVGEMTYTHQMGLTCRAQEQEAAAASIAPALPVAVIPDAAD